MQASELAVWIRAGGWRWVLLLYGAPIRALKLEVERAAVLRGEVVPRGPLTDMAELAEFLQRELPDVRFTLEASAATVWGLDLVLLLIQKGDCESAEGSVRRWLGPAPAGQKRLWVWVDREERADVIGRVGGTSDG